MNYTLGRPITRPLHELPTWHVSGRFGTYFVYVDIDRYANTITARAALQKTRDWLHRRHPYLVEEGRWLEGPYVRQVVFGLQWPYSVGDWSLPGPLL